MLSPAKLSDAAIGAFNDHPTDLIARYPSGGPALSGEVKRLAASDVGTTSKLIGLAKGAKPEHIVGLGIGLAQAAAICANTNPDLKDKIKKVVADSGDVALIAAFAAESSLYALAPEAPPTAPCKVGMGEPPDVTATSQPDELTPPARLQETSTSDQLGIGKSGFLYPFTFGVEPEALGSRRNLPSPFGGGGVVATSENVVSPTR
jgi:hypothetical protein